MNQMNWKREAEQKLRNYAACRRALTAIPLMIEENRYRREGVRSARVDGRAVSGGTNGREEMLVSSLDRQQALAALRAYPDGMQAGGGMTPENASDFLDAGASHVIVTSYIFRNGELDRERLARMQAAVGREHLVLDLSCRRRKDGSYAVVTDRWQKETSLTVDSRTLGALSAECGEFLIHAADVEGRRAGIELPLVRILGQWLAQRQKEGKTDFAVTYAGGIHSLEDVRLLRQASGGSLDFTVGSALDLFGGNLHLDALMEEASRKF